MVSGFLRMFFFSSFFAVGECEGRWVVDRGGERVLKGVLKGEKKGGEYCSHYTCFGGFYLWHFL